LVRDALSPDDRADLVVVVVEVVVVVVHDVRT
jgi:hypothetical protein